MANKILIIVIMNLYTYVFSSSCTNISTQCVNVNVKIVNSRISYVVLSRKIFPRML